MNKAGFAEFLKLLKQIENVEQVFSVSCRGETCFFAHVKVGTAIQVYRIDNTYESGLLHLSFAKEVALAAIIDHEENIYVASAGVFRIWESEARDFYLSLTKSGEIKSFYDGIADFESYIKEDYFIHRYTAKIGPYVFNEKQKENILKEIRFSAVTGKPMSSWVDSRRFVVDSDWLYVVCGLRDRDEVANHVCEANEKDLSYMKARNDLIAEFEARTDILSENERRISEATIASKAVNVNVEFVYRDKTAKIKIGTGAMLRIIAKKECFTRYSFCNHKDGEKLFEDLGVPMYEGLRFEDLQTVWYRGKVIYEKPVAPDKSPVNAPDKTIGAAQEEPRCLQPSTNESPAALVSSEMCTEDKTEMEKETEINSMISTYVEKEKLTKESFVNVCIEDSDLFIDLVYTLDESGCWDDSVMMTRKMQYDEAEILKAKKLARGVADALGIPLKDQIPEEENVDVQPLLARCVDKDKVTQESFVNIEAENIGLCVDLVYAVGDLGWKDHILLSLDERYGNEEIEKARKLARSVADALGISLKDQIIRKGE